MELKNYEFNAHGVELGQFYESRPWSGTARTDRHRHATPSCTTSPPPSRVRLPHVWVGNNNKKYSTHDLAAYGQFTLFTGITGEDWAAAAAEGRRSAGRGAKGSGHRPRP